MNRKQYLAQWTPKRFTNARWKPIRHAAEAAGKAAVENLYSAPPGSSRLILDNLGISKKTFEVYAVAYWQVCVIVGHALAVKKSVWAARKKEGTNE